jgi:hypothetical protein
MKNLETMLHFTAIGCKKGALLLQDRFRYADSSMEKQKFEGIAD